jgi:hypothetical protein
VGGRRVDLLQLPDGSFILAPTVFAQTTTGKPAVKYKTPELTVAQIDHWLAKPDQVLVLDIRRPDELIRFGSFPVFLNIQYADLEKTLLTFQKIAISLLYLITPAALFAAGDLLTSKGYKVIGAAGSENYEQQGGKAVTKIQKPAPKPVATHK